MAVRGELTATHTSIHHCLNKLSVRWSDCVVHKIEKARCSSVPFSLLSKGSRLQEGPHAGKRGYQALQRKARRLP